MSNNSDKAGARFDHANVRELMQRGRIERSRAFWAALTGLRGLLRSWRQAAVIQSGSGVGAAHS